MRGLALLLAIPWLAGCDGSVETAARLTVRQQAIDPPQLWLVQPLDPATEATLVCADTPMREGFVRTSGEIDGVPCRPTARPVDKPGLAALRCEAEGRSYAFSTVTRGDPARDFQLTVAVTPLDRSLGPAQTTRRFRRIGPCPAGWRIGDEGPPRAAPPGPLRRPGP